MNCGHQGHGKYCSECGQDYAELKKPFKDLVKDVFDLINLDERIFRSIGPFLLKPGFLSGEYLKGRRKKYISPFRLFLLMSLIFFFLAQATSKRYASNSDEDWVQIKTDTSDVVITDDSLAIELLSNDSIFGVRVDSLASRKSMRKADRNRHIRESAVQALTNKNLFIQGFFETISYSLFLLMPIFALLLKLLFIRRRVFYIEHLIFSIHMHAFALLVLSIMILLSRITGENNEFISVMLILIPVYFTGGMKRFYQQSYLKIILKEFILIFFYILILIITLLVAGFITLILM
jgi:hypothetical protein